MTLVPDAPTLDRVEAVSLAYTLDRLGVIAARPGNPMGAEHRRVGAVTALIAPRLPVGFFNAIHGLSDETVSCAADLLAWYAAEGVDPEIVLTPTREIGAVGRVLADAGFAHSRFHATFVGEPGLPRLCRSGVEVVRVSSDEELRGFDDAYHAGWETGFRVPVAPWQALAGWSLYLARLDGKPAGAGMLFMHERVAYLADSAVAPDARRAGVHAALLDARCDDSAAFGADLICSQAAFLSGSARNMQRKGLRLAYTQAIWAKA